MFDPSPRARLRSVACALVLLADCSGSVATYDAGRSGADGMAVDDGNGDATPTGDVGADRADSGTRTDAGSNLDAMFPEAGADAALDAVVDAPPVSDASVPGACANLARIGTGTSGRYWNRVLRTSVIFGGIDTVMNLDATDYIQMWQQPGAMIQWPGNTGTTTQPLAMPDYYFSERFTVPTDGSPPARLNYAWSGSGGWSNLSFALSICPGDFGQTGTQIQPGCTRNMPASSGGLTVVVSSTPSATVCTVVPGQTYYLNLLPEAELPINDVAVTQCTSRCLPWVGLN